VVSVHEVNDFQSYQNYQVKKAQKDSYKQKVIEIINLLNWNVDKFSKFVQKFKKKKINELTLKDWEEIYTYLSNKLYHTNEEKSVNYSEDLINEEKDIEIIKPEEWEEII
ncbi:MAG: hypothetical protein ACK4GR_04405, partial [bacterium]